MRTHKKVMTGAFLLLMMMAANFHNALNDYGIRSNAFMNGVIASGSNGSGSDGWFDNWDAEYPSCIYSRTDYIRIRTDSSDPIPEGYEFDYHEDGYWVYKKVIIDWGSTRVCKPGAGLCLYGSECCLHRNFLGLCTD